LSKGTIKFYKKKLRLFSQYCEGQAIQHITQITPQTLREYLVWLEQRGHNPGGIHAFYRAVKTFLFWWEDEIELEGWKNPIRRVKAPKVAIEPLQGLSTDNFQAMLETCDNKRDKAILLA
jgi:site-specific recombinase XerD